LKRALFPWVVGVFQHLVTRSHATPESDFWRWFQNNEEILFDFEKGPHRILNRLSAAMHRVHPSLTYEFGPKENSTREFVLSADGIKEAFPRVEALYAVAPQLPRWKFIKFRPRREPGNLTFKDVSVRAEDVFVLVEPDQTKVGITIFLPRYSKEVHQTFVGIAFLLLDHALGEYDVETRVGFIECKPLDNRPITAVGLKELPEVFDSCFAKIS